MASSPNGYWAVETRGLSKHFGAVRAVEGLELRVRPGTVYGLVGPNGAGKTTTLRLLAGLLEPTRGVILMGGQVVAAADGWARRAISGRRATRPVQWQVGYMPDFFGVYEDMRVWEYLDFFGRCYGLPAGQRRMLVDELLELVDLSEKRDSDVHQLSRGMKQRLCLARTLVHDPQVLLLDEPASGLDPRARIEIRELLLELRAMGKTVIISSHILAELADMCDSVGIMEGGRLLASGPLEEIERRLQAGQVVRIRTAAAIETALEVLADLPGVEVLSHQAEGGRGTIEARIEGEELAAAEVLARLVEARVPVMAFAPRQRDLEAVFMQITSGEVS